MDYYNYSYNNPNNNYTSSSIPSTQIITSSDNNDTPSNYTRSRANNPTNNNNGKKGNTKNGSKGVRLSTDPQSVAARERRHRISDRFKTLQSLVPGGAKLDTVSMLEQAIQYVKFLKAQIWLHQTIINNNNTSSDNNNNLNNNNNSSYSNFNNNDNNYNNYEHSIYNKVNDAYYYDQYYYSLMCNNFNYCNQGDNDGVSIDPFSSEVEMKTTMATNQIHNPNLQG